TGMVKSLVVEGEGGAFQLLLRGDHELNLVKAARAVESAFVQLAEPERVRVLTGIGVGSLGPVGAKLPLVADLAVADLAGFVCGANDDGKHLLDVVFDRDLPKPRLVDLRNVVAGDGCPCCQRGALRLDRGIEVGHVFKLGDKYTRAMNVTVQDADGRERTPIMGCYGIGVSRIVAAAIEQNHDENGMIWPVAIAPFAVEILLVNPKEGEAVQMAERLLKGLKAVGIEAFLDDRDERLGVKFKDADLLGMPWRAVVGGRSLKEGTVEIQRRAHPDKVRVATDEVVGWLISRLQTGEGA
ncbi:MAG: proline--tRNA ligase, partial [Magnetococcales bacterium]|nr:proline--tRNA ligase [Magnetococcales bacterium]